MTHRAFSETRLDGYASVGDDDALGLGSKRACGIGQTT
jgi:hypothetical protein